MQVAQPFVAGILGDRLPGGHAINHKTHVTAIARQPPGQPQPDPVTAPIGDGYAGAGVGFSFKDLPCRNDMRLVLAFDWRGIWARSGGQNHDFGCHIVDQLRGDFGACGDGDTCGYGFAGQVLGDATKLGASGQELGKVDLPTKSFSCLQQRHIMTAFRSATGGFQTGGTTANAWAIARHSAPFSPSWSFSSAERRIPRARSGPAPTRAAAKT